MKWLLAVFSLTTICTLLSVVVADTPAGSELEDEVQKREARFDGNVNRFFGQGLHSRQGNTMINWNSLLSKRGEMGFNPGKGFHQGLDSNGLQDWSSTFGKRGQMAFYPGKGFRQGLDNNGLQDWSTTFGRDGRAFASTGNRISPLGSAALDEDGMQNWRAFYRGFASRSRRSSDKSINES